MTLGAARAAGRDLRGVACRGGARADQRPLQGPRAGVRHGSRGPAAAARGRQPRQRARRARADRGPGDRVWDPLPLFHFSPTGERGEIGYRGFSVFDGYYGDPAATAAAVAAPDRRYGEVPAAFVQLHPGARVEADDLIAHCLDAIATYKVPRYVRFVDEWPMSGTKIQKFRLRERLAHELADAGVDQAPKPRERGLGRSR